MTGASRAEAWLVRGLIAVFLVLHACKDAADAAQDHLYDEHFEDRCDDAPCGWSHVAGGAADVAYVSTFHPADHALRLAGTAVVSGPPAESARGIVLRFGSIGARAALRCDVGSSLTLAATLADASPGGGGRTLGVFEGRLSAPSAWGEAVTVTLTGRSVSPDGGAGGAPTTGVTVRVTSVVITHVGTGGGCELADLILDDATTLEPTTSKGCE